MKTHKLLMAGLLALGACCSLCFPVTRVMGLSYVVQGVYQLTVPSGARQWTASLAAGNEYEVSLGLFTPGHADFELTMVDPWGQHYTFVDLTFWHSASSDDLYGSTFTPPLTGTYAFTLATSGGTGQALQAYFAILDAGPIDNANTHAGSFRDAHACNLSHQVWSYFLPLEGSTTYFIDVARGDPSGAEVPIVVSAKVQALNGLEIPVLAGEEVPWEMPKCNDTQGMEWAGEWFGVAASTTYNLVVEVSGLTSLDPVVVAITVSKEQAHGSAEPPAEDPSKDAGTNGLEVSWDGVMVVAAPCAIALLVAGIAIVGTKRKKGIRGTTGVMKRELPASEEGW